MMLDGGPLVRAQAMFRRALAADPTLASARLGLISSFAGAELDPTTLSPTEAALVEAGSLLRSQDWKALSTLDGELSKVKPADLCFGSAVRARVAWRIEGQDPEDGKAAIVLIDQLLTRERTADHYFMRAKAGALAGDPAIAWAALNQVVANGRPRPYLIKASLELARRLGTPPEGSRLIDQLMMMSRSSR
jgi:hypothetical protein